MTLIYPSLEYEINPGISRTTFDQWSCCFIWSKKRKEKKLLPMRKVPKTAETWVVYKE